jgi:hypothetical protein
MVLNKPCQGKIKYNSVKKINEEKDRIYYMIGYYHTVFLINIFIIILNIMLNISKMLFCYFIFILF